MQHSQSMKSYKTDLFVNCYSRYGQKMDNMFRAPGTKEISDSVHKNQNTSDTFYIERSRAPKKALTQQTVENSDQNLRRHLEDAAFGSRLYKQFEPKLMKELVFTTLEDEVGFGGEILDYKKQYVDRQKQIDAEKFLWKTAVEKGGKMSIDNIKRISIHVGEPKYLEHIIISDGEEESGSGANSPKIKRRCTKKKTRIERVHCPGSQTMPMDIQTDIKNAMSNSTGINIEVSQDLQREN